jgi:hypothetical protein
MSFNSSAEFLGVRFIVKSNANLLVVWFDLDIGKPKPAIHSDVKMGLCVPKTLSGFIE